MSYLLLLCSHVVLQIILLSSCHSSPPRRHHSASSRGAYDGRWPQPPQLSATHSRCAPQRRHAHDGRRHHTLPLCAAHRHIFLSMVGLDRVEDDDIVHHQLVTSSSSSRSSSSRGLSSGLKSSLYVSTSTMTVAPEPIRPKGLYLRWRPIIHTILKSHHPLGAPQQDLLSAAQCGILSKVFNKAFTFMGQPSHAWILEKCSRNWKSEDSLTKKMKIAWKPKRKMKYK